MGKGRDINGINGVRNGVNPEDFEARQIYNLGAEGIFPAEMVRPEGYDPTKYQKEFDLGRGNDLGREKLIADLNELYLQPQRYDRLLRVINRELAERYGEELANLLYDSIPRKRKERSNLTFP